MGYQVWDPGMDQADPVIKGKGFVTHSVPGGLNITGDTAKLGKKKLLLLFHGNYFFNKFATL